MKTWVLAASLMTAAPAAAAPPDTVSPMALPGAGGYMQPGNPDRGISMVGRESALVRARPGERVTCTSRGAREARCRVGDGSVRVAHRIAGRCRARHDWFQARGAVVVRNGCSAVFAMRRYG